jgi:hypothetical protein
MKKVFIVFAFVIMACSVDAQIFRTAVGVRGGVTQGFTLKHFVTNNTGFDFILGSHYRGASFIALYQIHNHNVFDVPNLSFFYGFGGHIGHYNHQYAPWGFTENTSVIGADLVIGIEYTFDEIPVNIGLDIKPALNIIPEVRYWQGGALYIRYVFR